MPKAINIWNHNTEELHELVKADIRSTAAIIASIAEHRVPMAWCPGMKYGELKTIQVSTDIFIGF